MRARIAVTLIAGYLGSGKTTAINSFLSQVRGRRVAVLVNDFGAINVDAELIDSRTDQAISLSNGCVCCTISDDLGDALDAQLARADPPEHILVEASGVSESPRIARHVAGWPGVELSSVVCLADAGTLVARSNDKHTGGLVLRQLRAADLVVLNKLDLTGEERALEVRTWLETVAPGRKVIVTSRGQVDPATLLEPCSGPPMREMVFEPRPFHTPQFASRVWHPEGPVDLGRLAEVFRNMPPTIHRAKGFVRTGGNPAQAQLIQFAEGRLEMSPITLRAGQAVAYVVVIGACSTRELAEACRQFASCSTQAG